MYRYYEVKYLILKPFELASAEEIVLLGILAGVSEFSLFLPANVRLGIGCVCLLRNRLLITQDHIAS